MVAEQPERFKSNFSSSCLFAFKIFFNRALSAISLIALSSSLTILGGAYIGYLGAIVLLLLLELIFGLFFKSISLAYSIDLLSIIFDTGADNLLSYALIDSPIV